MTMTIPIIRDLFAAQYEQGAVHEGTIELIGASFVADEPSIFGEPNADYIQRELDWYLTEVPSIRFMKPPVPKIWEAVAGKDGLVNSQYGYLVFSPENGEQYNHVLNELRKNPGSRRGTTVYTRPDIHRTATQHGMNDFICTNAVNYVIRDGLLYATVQMRSNDAVFGYRNDWAWQVYVFNKLAEDLGIGTGGMVWQAASLHVYERHFHLIEDYINTHYRKES